MAGIKKLCVLGATGSVGGATLAVVRHRRAHFAVTTLVADTDAAAMRKLCQEFCPAWAVMRDEMAAEELSQMLRADGSSTAVKGGASAVRDAPLGDCCTVVAAISGAEGLSPTLAAVQAGRRVLLANKESLALAGGLLMAAARDSGATILPIDSEHAALFQLLGGSPAGEGDKLWLTASGGAFLSLPMAQLAEVTPTQALAHPTWSMGAKITVDSATMMNKALEVIEATMLFAAAADSIGVVIHPQSIVHAMVEKSDGTLTAQLSMPDMRLPIAQMLAWPAEEALMTLPRPSWADLSGLTFAEPEAERYPCLQLARDALAAGGAAPGVLSAANEAAVARFLRGDIKFTDIARINYAALAKHADCAADSLEDLLAADRRARQWAAAA